jgi:hypothetical protein
MPFDWNDYLTIAKEFKTRTDGQTPSNLNEAMQRTAVSRAYYSMFHLALEYAKNHFGYNPQRGGPNQAHADIRSEYQKQMASPDHQEIAQILRRVHKARVDCDYKPEDLGNLTAQLESVVLDADRVQGILTGV